MSKLHESDEYTRMLKLAAVRKRGGKCTLCGFSDYRALQFDHIKGGGSGESRRLVYLRVICSEALDLQLLCANCNTIKNIEKAEGCRTDLNQFFLNAMKEDHVTVKPQREITESIGGSTSVATNPGGPTIQ